LTIVKSLAMNSGYVESLDLPPRSMPGAREVVQALFTTTQGGDMKASVNSCATAMVRLGAVLMIVTPAIALAADVIDVGKLEYDSACASCHGRKGAGDGPLKDQLKTSVPDLRVLARNNGGVFPFDRVYQIIDGRQELKIHGPRDMPVWGYRFNAQSSVYFENYPAHDAESGARSRILALTEYIYRLQSK